MIAQEVFLQKEIFRNLFRAEKKSVRMIAACYVNTPSISLVGRILHDYKGGKDLD